MDAFLGAHAKELVNVFSWTPKGGDHTDFSYPLYVDLRDNSPLLDGLAAYTSMGVGVAAGQQTERVVTELYGLPESTFAEAGRLRGEAAEVRDRGASRAADGPTGRGAEYWPRVAGLLRASYRSLAETLTEE